MSDGHLNFGMSDAPGESLKALFATRFTVTHRKTTDCLDHMNMSIHDSDHFVEVVVVVPHCGIID
jgi:hypothetical protein